EVVDCIAFCTKNPAPMFPYMDLLKNYGQYWYVTITPYAKDIEPNVPDKHKLLEDFKELSKIVGINSIGWRYDPILLSDRYTKEYHLRAFEQMAKTLKGYTNTVVISFVDLYPKVVRNFPEVRRVTKTDRLELGEAIIKIAADCGMTVKPCAEGDELAQFGADCSGCMKISDYEAAIGSRLNAPKTKGARAECACYLSCDIGAYNTCLHLCRYCYANAEPETVMRQNKMHEPSSPLLIGHLTDDDIIHNVPQESWTDKQTQLKL
ncbi:MAG: DUF1848 domain-containing protein, partial [Clostridia bacterium]|nr:DUF1848 domain-containing protein [Clostridia bacterium]